MNCKVLWSYCVLVSIFLLFVIITVDVRWFNAGGGLQQSEQWDEGSTLGLAISRPDLEKEEGIWHDVLMLFNPFEGDVPFQIPQFGEGGWVLESRNSS